MLTASPFNLKFAKAIAGVCAVWLCGVVQGGTTATPLFRRETQSCMGTKWHIALYADDASSANAALKLAWGEIREIDRCLSNYLPDSELNRFCRDSPHGDYIQVSEHLATVLRAAANLSEQSDGYFDVTIAPVANLWRRARAKHRLPKADRLQAARQLVNWRFIEFGNAPRQVRITAADVRIDLGGIAKGYAVDRAVEVLQAAGIESALVNGGGDLRAIGKTPDSHGWPIKIAGATAGDDQRNLVLDNAAVATSGDTWQYLEVDGKRYSHLIDPKTGIGSTRRLSVTVYAPTCMRADALASALSVMPTKDGLTLAAASKDVEVLITEVTRSGESRTKSTAGFPAE